MQANPSWRIFTQSPGRTMLASRLKLLNLDSVPQVIKQRLESALDDFRNMGLETHVRATYGDQSARTPPWKLIQEREAMTGLEQARRATTLAETIFAEMSKV